MDKQHPTPERAPEPPGGEMAGRLRAIMAYPGRRQCTNTNAAELLGVTAAQISKMRWGKAPITAEQLQVLADHVDFPKPPRGSFGRDGFEAWR